MSLHVQIPIRANDCPIETTSDKFGALRESIDAVQDAEKLRKRMKEDGYLYLPGFFPKQLVQEARASIIGKLEQEGVIDESHPAIEGYIKEGVEMYFRPDIAEGDEKIERLIYGPEILAFFERFLGGEVLHFDYTWLRAVAHGLGTSPHCDIVYMGRGTTNLYTAWTPLGNVPINLGGLIVLEGSHFKAGLKETYGQLDVDVMCSNDPGKNILASRGYDESGAITLDPHALREELGGRWLTAEYQMGDLLIFSMYTVHASLDNQTHQIRMSTDSRYQLASEPVDERWYGPNRTGHSEGKKNLIC